MKITLTIKQRLELAGVIRAVCRGKKKDPKRRRGHDIISKIKISDDQIALYETNIPGMGAVRNEARIKTGPESEVDLTVDEARFLESICDEGFSNLGPEDDEWYDDIQEKLATISEAKSTAA